ncbi:MAG: ATP:cob(I)alamin adenosyltransferase [Verrucomicrobiae bacterium]|nr:ATP:cob(I)alamin adenosyltransferase [Verrucomicrobiae bacterium]NNJ86728.1 ATP:cob(I)alamin adenosyltransferase [Akkermansiaceae bacterium]
MSIITRRGDDGETDVMYGGRMPKNAPEVVACGAVDELNAALGMVRVAGVPESMVGQIDTIQGHLVSLMGLLSVPAAKRSKYLADGFPSVSEDDISWLESIAVEMPTEFDGWARPGASGNAGAAWMDMARTICRRAELAAWGLGEGASPEACRFLNRLSDILWLWARKLEK